MDTILFFHTSLRQAWRRELAGAYRYARTRGWRVQVVEPQEGPPPVAELAKFWRPAGCIAECSGTGGALLTPRLFKGVPTVFLGNEPAMMPDRATFIAPAPSGIGERAAREFLEAGIASFGFVAKFADKFWSRDREKDFARTLALHPRRALCVAREGKTADFGEVARDDVVGRPDAAGEDVAVGECADKLLVLLGEEDRLLALLDKPTPSMVCQWLVASC